MSMYGRKAMMLLILLVTAMLLLTGCRVRTSGVNVTERPIGASGSSETAVSAEAGAASGAENGPKETKQTGVSEEAADDSRDHTRERRDAERKEYDEDAAVEIVEGTGRTLHGEGYREGAASDGDGASNTVPKLDAAADETATQIVSAEASDRMGVSPEADEAESAAVYYTVLLRDRLGTLFECKRLTAYLETSADHTTIYRTSPGHALLTEAGVYDASSRLLEQNLLVSDGWVCRKNPELIVKFVGGSVLGHGAADTGAAESIRSALTARADWSSMNALRNRRVLLLSDELMEASWLRTAAALLIAREAYPSLFADVDPERALRQLAEEATGMPPSGVYYLSWQGGNQP
ncbi:MAG: hypothetical protein IJK28_10435 [Clostridia bacterium]|nr:hypothetical protein [Clostridia bacterium]